MYFPQLFFFLEMNQFPLFSIAYHQCDTLSEIPRTSICDGEKTIDRNKRYVCRKLADLTFALEVKLGTEWMK